MIRNWKRIDVDDLPSSVREAAVYAGTDWWVENSLISPNGRAIRLRFEGEIIHVWRLTGGCWILASRSEGVAP